MPVLTFPIYYNFPLLITSVRRNKEYLKSKKGGIVKFSNNNDKIGEYIMIPLTEIFCLIDDFCKHFDTEQNKYVLQNPKRKVDCSIGLSEIITIIVMFHLSHYRTFKDFNLCCLCPNYRKEFLKLVSYSCFVELMAMLLLLKSLSGKQIRQYYITHFDQLYNTLVKFFNTQTST